MSRLADNLPPIWNIRFPSNDHFFARENELASIKEHLNSFHICVVHPPTFNAATGTSQLVREYSYNEASTYQMVWWLNGSTIDSFHMGILQLGMALELAAGSPPTPLHSLDDIKVVLNEHSGWLLVVDDVVALEPILEFIGENPSGHCLITSPSDAWMDHCGYVSVSQVSADVVAEKILPDVPETDLDIIEVASTSVLGATLLKAYQKVSNTPWEDIRKSLPTFSPNDADAYEPLFVRVVLSMALEHLTIQARVARDYLALICFLDYAEIPISLIETTTIPLSKRLDVVKEEGLLLEKAIQPLVELGLVEMGEHSLRMHPLIQSMIRDGMADKPIKAWCGAAIKLISKAFPDQQTYDATNRSCIRLIPHVMTASQHAEKLRVTPGEVSSILYRAGLYFEAHQILDSAQMAMLRSIHLFEKAFNTAHPILAVRVNSLGVVEQKLGNLDSAQACFERAMDICEKVFGPTEEAVYTKAHETMLTMPLRNLCTIIEERGDTAAAQKLFEKALNTFVQVYGWKHSMVAECAHRLGQIWLHLGQLDKAKTFLDKAVLAEENAAVCDTKALALYLNSVGAVSLRQNDITSAQKQIERALRLDIQEYGERHMAVARDFMNLAQVFKRVDDYERAEEMFNKSLEIMETNDYMESVEAGAVLTQLGGTLISNGKAAQARTVLEQAQATIQGHGPVDTSSMLQILVNLGRCMNELNAQSQAMNYFEQALELAESDGEAFRSQKGMIHYRMGRLYHSMGELDRAHKEMKIAEEIDTSCFGDRHPSVARDVYGLGSLLADQKDTIVAMGHITLALDIFEENYGKDHPKTRMARKKLDSLTRF
jgi:tetratricopeptide (TPR) repeat protein